MSNGAGPAITVRSGAIMSDRRSVGVTIPRTLVRERIPRVAHHRIRRHGALGAVALWENFMATINNIADLFVSTLERAGVRRIYGIVGDSLNGLTEALRRHGTIEWIHVRHEEVAAFAAAGEA